MQAMFAKIASILGELASQALSLVPQNRVQQIVDEVLGDDEPVGYLLGMTERAYLAVTSLGMRAETHEGLISDRDIIEIARSYATDEDELLVLANWMKENCTNG